MTYIQPECSICHSVLTRFGNVTVKDGTVCRNCRKLCSPFLENEAMAEMTVEQVIRHLDYRRENEERMHSLNFSLILEGRYNLFTDETGEYFCFSKKQDCTKENCDVLSVSDIERIQITRGFYRKNPEKVDVYLIITLKNENVPVVKFRINEFPNIDNNGSAYTEAVFRGLRIRNCLLKQNI